MENEIELRIKLLMRKQKEHLILLAQGFKLSTEGSKKEIAERIAEYQMDDAIRNWNAIQGTILR